MTKHTTKPMDPTVFALAFDRLQARGKSYEAARLVMVEGKPVQDAALMFGIKRSAVYEAIDRINRAYEDLGICADCGQRLPNV